MTDAHTPERPIPSIRSFLGDGWLGLEPEPETDADEVEHERIIREIEEFDADLHATFRRSRAGKRVWSRLWKFTILRPPFDGNLGLDMGTAVGFMRSGQSALMMDIHNRMERHENG